MCKLQKCVADKVVGGVDIFILAVICVHNYVIIIDHRCWLLCNASLSALIFTDEELQ